MKVLYDVGTNGDVTVKDVQELPVGLNVKDHLLLCLLDWKNTQKEEHLHQSLVQEERLP